MDTQMQKYYTQGISPADYRTFKLLTLLSKLAMALVLSIVAVVVSFA